MDQVKIGRFLSQLRKEKGLSQETLAEKIGVTNKTISRWETGTYMPDVEMMKILAEFFGVSVDELLSGERAKNIPDLFPIPNAPPAQIDEKADAVTRFNIGIRRLFAWIIDFWIIMSVDLLLAFSSVGFNASPTVKGIIVPLFSYALIWPLFSITVKNLVFKNASIGKKLMKIEIVQKEDGRIPTKSKLIGRALFSVFLYYADGICMLVTGGTSLGDIITKTKVVYSKNSKMYGKVVTEKEIKQQKKKKVIEIIIIVLLLATISIGMVAYMTLEYFKTPEWVKEAINASYEYIEKSDKISSIYGEDFSYKIRGYSAHRDRNNETATFNGTVYIESDIYEIDLIFEDSKWTVIDFYKK